jgi:hypothetical protein
MFPPEVISKSFFSLLPLLFMVTYGSNIGISTLLRTLLRAPCNVLTRNNRRNQMICDGGKPPAVLTH